MAEEELTLEQFSALLTNIDSSLGPAATQLWEEEVNTEDLLRNRTKKDMYEAGINLSSRNLIFNHYHPIDAGQYELCVVLGIAALLIIVNNFLKAVGQSDKSIITFWGTIFLATVVIGQSKPVQHADDICGLRSCR